MDLFLFLLETETQQIVLSLAINHFSLVVYKPTINKTCQILGRKRHKIYVDITCLTHPSYVVMVVCMYNVSFSFTFDKKVYSIIILIVNSRRNLLWMSEIYMKQHTFGITTLIIITVYFSGE